MVGHGQPPISPPAADYFVISYYTFFTIALPLCFLVASCYCWASKRLWECCCYYDVESALETQPPSSPSPSPGNIIPCLPRLSAEPPMWERAAPPPERIREIAASCAECAICTVALLDGDGEGEEEMCSTLPLCGHRFHRVCVYVWLHRQATCPVCRRFYPFPVRSRLSLLLRKEKGELTSGL